MNVHHTLICFFFVTVLQDGNTGLINAEIPSFTRTEGQNITVTCYFTETGDKKYLCKESEETTSPKLFNDCDQAERIFEMKNDSRQSGRYSMRYETTSTGSRLNVTITHLNKSDSGRYTCALDLPAAIDPYQEFKIIVTDGPSTSTPKMTTRPFLTSAPSASTTTTTTTTNQSEQTAGGSGVLYVGLTLVLIVLLSSVAVLILCKKRASKPKEHPEETECVDVTETSRVYEEIREGDRQSRSPPVENSVEASGVYSLVTDTASRPLSKTDDDLNELDYTDVDFSNRAAASLSSAPSGHADNVIYSMPQTHTDAKVESQLLYSTITLPQQ